MLFRSYNSAFPFDGPELLKKSEKQQITGRDEQ